MPKVVFLLAFLAISMNSFAQKPVEFEWMVGSWVQQENDISTTESWEMQGDSILVGRSETVRNDQVVIHEDLKIVFGKEKITYEAILPNKTASFDLTELDKQRVIFVDIKNDFPKTITYIRKDSMMDVVLEGKQDGKDVSSTLHFQLFP